MRLKDRFTLPFWFLFWLRKTALAILSSVKKQSINRKKELELAAQEAGKDEEMGKKNLGLNGVLCLTTPFNSPASGGHWAHTYRVDMATMILQWLDGKLGTAINAEIAN